MAEKKPYTLLPQVPPMVIPTEPRRIRQRDIMPQAVKPAAAYYLVPYEHTITAAEVAAGTVELTIPHGLKFVPQVPVASFFITSDSRVRQLPFTLLKLGPVFGDGPSLIMAIDSIDELYIYLRISIFDIFGLSFVSSNLDMKFKFYCQQGAATE